MNSENMPTTPPPPAKTSSPHWVLHTALSYNDLKGRLQWILALLIILRNLGIISDEVDVATYRSVAHIWDYNKAAFYHLRRLNDAQGLALPNVIG